MTAGHLLLAYHGCDVTIRDDLVAGRLPQLSRSNNKYDWLGPGAYFFEGDYKRALMFANASVTNPERRYTAKPIATPAVVGVILRVQRWLDMTIQDGIEEFVLALNIMVQQFETEKKKLPKNVAAAHDDADVLLRGLDNAVFTFLHKTREEMQLPAFQVVRAAFPQGAEIAPTSGFRQTSHIQLALRDTSCVAGWFLPPGAQLLTEAEYQEKSTLLAEAKATYAKPRVRSSASG